MPVEQFKRAFRVQIGDTTFDSSPVRPLKFRFQIERDIEKPPNNASIQIFNLAEDTRAFLAARKFVACKIDAGYQDQLTQVFFGDLRRATSEKVGPDWITSLDAGDGEKNITQVRIAKTFRKGTKLTVVLKSIAKSLALGTGNLDTAVARYANGRDTLATTWIALGNAADELEYFCRSVGIRWSSQDGQLMLLTDDRPAFSGGPLITPETGLIGSPTIDSDGAVELTCLLLPDLLPGVSFQVESEQCSGKFVASHTIHVGDSTEGDWFVKVKGKPLK